MKYLVIIISLFSINAFSNGFISDLDDVVTFGPNISFNLSKQHPEFTMGFQTSYYQSNNGGPYYGAGAGIEYSFTHKINRFYLDAKGSFVLFGSSAGLVWDENLGFGSQVNVWGSYLAGGGLQYRKFFNQPDPRLRMNAFLSAPIPVGN